MKKQDFILVGTLVDEVLNRDESLFKDIFPNTELSIDLKLLTRKPGRMALGSHLDGMLTHDGEDHFTFIQNAVIRRSDVGHRNPHVYVGECINVNRRPDGTLYPTLKSPAYTEDFTFEDFCREVAAELLMVAGEMDLE